MRFFTKRTTIFIICGFFFILAGVFQYIDQDLSSYWATVCSFYETSIFLLLIFIWGYSIKIRIIDKGIRRKLLFIAALLFFWLFIRYIKYEFTVSAERTNRYLWYLFYIPQCIVPPLALIVSLETTQDEKHPIRKWIYLILIPAFILIIMILTNDFHQLAFKFKPNFENFSSDYKHGIVYYLAIGWIIIMILTHILVLIIKCSVSSCKKKTWIPISLFLICTIACILCFIYSTRSYKMPELLSFSFIIIFESCIAIGLIPSNENYEVYFSNSSISSIITDKNLNPIYGSNNLLELSKDDCKKTLEDGFIFIGENNRLSVRNISGGYIFYIEDLSHINKLLDEIKNLNEAIKEDSNLIIYENELKKKEIKIKQKNYMHDNLLIILKDDLSLTNNLLLKIKEDDTNFYKNFKEACVHLAYIKRRSNLELLLNQNEYIDFNEIILSIKEITNYLRLYGIENLLINNTKEKIKAEIGILFFEFFMDSIRLIISDIIYLIINIRNDNNKITMRLAITLKFNFDYDFNKLKSEKYKNLIDIIKEDDTYYLTFKMDIKE